MEEATFLSRFASKVTILHRRDEFRASKIMIDRVRANEKIKFMTPYVVEDVLDVSKGAVEGVRVRHAGTNEISVIPATGVFVAIGHDPNTKPFVGKLKMDAAGYLVTRNGPLTDVEGVFACGDVQDHVYRQAVTAAGSGCMAAIEAERFLENHPA
jgi:thioredoxin reductase (NADPH)